MQTGLYEVEFSVVALNPVGIAGPVYRYRRPIRKCVVAAPTLFSADGSVAVSATPGQILAVLRSNIAVGPGESIEVSRADFKPGVGSEGAAVLS